MEGEILVRSAEYADEMCFEGLDRLFGNVATMIVRWDELVSHVVCSDCLLELGGALVVEDVSFGGDAGSFESVNELLISSCHFARRAVFHGLLQDSVAVWVREYHDVMVATTGFLGELSCLIRVDGVVALILDGDDLH